MLFLPATSFQRPTDTSSKRIVSPVAYDPQFGTTKTSPTLHLHRRPCQASVIGDSQPDDESPTVPS